MTDEFSKLRELRQCWLSPSSSASLIQPPAPETAPGAATTVDDDGDHCVLGVLGEKRHAPIKNIDPEDSYAVSEAFGIANALACEIVYINDEAGNYGETPQERWGRVRTWVSKQIDAGCTQRIESS